MLPSVPRFLALAAALVASTAAASLDTRQFVPQNTFFKIRLSHPGSAMDGKFVQAYKAHFYAGLSSQGAQGCSANEAYFYYVNGELFLHSPSNTKQQALYISSNGLFTYITYGRDDFPTTPEMRQGWSVSPSGDLRFKTFSFQVCPGLSSGAGAGAWDVYMDSTGALPGGYTGCVSASGQAIAQPNAPACLYTASK